MPAILCQGQYHRSGGQPVGRGSNAGYAERRAGVLFQNQSGGEPAGHGLRCRQCQIGRCTVPNGREYEHLCGHRPHCGRRQRYASGLCGIECLVHPYAKYEYRGDDRGGCLPGGAGPCLFGAGLSGLRAPCRYGRRAPAVDGLYSLGIAHGDHCRSNCWAGCGAVR